MAKSITNEEGAVVTTATTQPVSRAPGTIVGIPTEDGQLRGARKIPWQRQDVIKMSPMVRWYNFTGLTQASFQGVLFHFASGWVETPGIIEGIVMDAYHKMNRKDEHFSWGMHGSVTVGPLEPRKE